MSDMILMICKYCGGKLVNVENNLWECDSCGTKTLIEKSRGTDRSAEGASAGGFSVSVEHGGKTSEYRVRKTAEFDIGFDRRATMADACPMTVRLNVDGKERGAFEHLPKTGKGSISFEADGDCITAYSTGKASLERIDGSPVDEQNAEGEYLIAGLKVTVKEQG